MTTALLVYGVTGAVAIQQAYSVWVDTRRGRRR